MVSFVHTADIHVGAKFRGLGDEKGDIRREDILKTLRSIVDLVLERDLDGLLIVGDLFDERATNVETVSTIVNILSKLGSSDKWCVIVPGNHDPIGDNSPYNKVNFPHDITIIKNTEGFEQTELPGLRLYASAFAEENRTAPKLRDLYLERLEDIPTIVAIHGSVEPNNNFWSNNTEGSQYCPISLNDIEKLNVDYVALGHFHSYKQLSSNPVALYPGSPEGLGYGETGQRYVAAINIDSNGVKVEQIPVGEKIYVQLPESTDEWDTLKIINKLDKNSDKNKLLRWKIKGWAKDGNFIDIERISNSFNNQYFDLKVETDFILPDDLIVGSDYSAPSIFKRKMTAAIKECEDPVEQKRLIDAYMFGVSLFGGIRQ
jgi:DNA repair exonuclease SbcCD nuclease subunit